MDRPNAYCTLFEGGAHIVIPTLSEASKVCIGTMLHAILRGNEEYKNNGIVLDIGEDRAIEMFIGRETQLYKYLEEYGFRKIELPKDEA